MRDIYNPRRDYTYPDGRVVQRKPGQDLPAIRQQGRQRALPGRQRRGSSNRFRDRGREGLRGDRRDRWSCGQSTPRRRQSSPVRLVTADRQDGDHRRRQRRSGSQAGRRSHRVVGVAGKVWQSMVSAFWRPSWDSAQDPGGPRRYSHDRERLFGKLIFALTVILTGKDHVFTNRYAVYFLLAALVAFVISAVIAIVVQTRGFNYDVIKRQTLKRLTDPDAASWTSRPMTLCAPTSASTSKRSAACATATTTMATRLTWSLRAGLRRDDLIVGIYTHLSSTGQICYTIWHMSGTRSRIPRIWPA